MLNLAFPLLLLAAQPADGPVSTQKVVPPPSAAAMEAVKARADAEMKKQEADAEAGRTQRKTMWPQDFISGADPTFEEALAASYGDKAPKAPQTEEERRAAANAAAIARAAQAGADVNAPPGPWPEEGKMRCRPTETGFVCGNSDKALEPDSPSRQALDALLNKPD